MYKKLFSPTLVSGMTLVESDREPVHIPVFGSDEVADVTGAGDTVRPDLVLAMAGAAAALDGWRPNLLPAEFRRNRAREMRRGARKVSTVGAVIAVPLLRLGVIVIVAGMRLDYVKKARGTITGECRIPPIGSNVRNEYEVPVTLKDESGDVVVNGMLRTLVGPKQI